MTVCVLSGEEVGLLKSTPRRSLDLLIVIRPGYGVKEVRRLMKLAAPTLSEKGELIIAESLPAAFEQL